MARVGLQRHRKQSKHSHCGRFYLRTSVFLCQYHFMNVRYQWFPEYYMSVMVTVKFNYFLIK